MNLQRSNDSDHTILAPPAAHNNALMPGTRLGEFEILHVIGQGGFGIVYFAKDHSLGRDVAAEGIHAGRLRRRAQGNTQVTMLSEHYAETFQIGLHSFVNEAQLLAKFDHPGLVKVYRFWEANGTGYMAMPFYDAPTLKQMLKEDKARLSSEAWLKNMLRHVLDALQVLHEKQCYHRDIAPDNILMLAGEQPLLLDFGAARRVIGDMTQALTVILKPGYAPIEQYGDVPNMTRDRGPTCMRWPRWCTSSSPTRCRCRRCRAWCPITMEPLAVSAAGPLQSRVPAGDRRRARGAAGTSATKRRRISRPARLRRTRAASACEQHRRQPATPDLRRGKKALVAAGGAALAVAGRRGLADDAPHDAGTGRAAAAAQSPRPCRPRPPRRPAR